MTTTDYVHKLCEDAVAENFWLVCFYDDASEPDYSGRDVNKAVEALRDCDMMVLEIRSSDEIRGRALIIPELDNDEQIADYSGDWLDNWWKANVR